MTTDVRTLLDRDPFDASSVADLREALGRDPSRYKTLREAVTTMKERHKGAMSGDVHLRLGEHLLVASAEPGFQAAPDDPIWIDFDQARLHLFDSQTQEALPAAGAQPTASAAPVSRAAAP